MPREKSGMTWFEDEEWIGFIVTFEKQPSPTTWELVQKIREREKWHSEYSWTESHVPSEARGIFICEEGEGPARRQAVIKIYMQIPYIGTISKPRRIRAMQARTEIDFLAKQEITALQGLTDANCSSVPSLLAWKNTVQDDERYVPGGYITYVLMERCPGITLEYFFDLPREERDQVRAAFKKARQECIQCGYHHVDEANRNLIWDKEQQKCYLVDWEHWLKPSARQREWKDYMYLFWGLASRLDGGILDDTSTWTW